MPAEEKNIIFRYSSTPYGGMSIDIHDEYTPFITVQC
jgi:hypothetical protein